MELLYNIDLEILLFIQTYLRHEIVTPLFKMITSLGDYSLIWLIIIIWLLSKEETRKTGYYMLLGFGLCIVFTNGILKNVVGRMRPFDLYEEIIPLINKPRDYSFPSGHTSMSFTIAVLVYRLVDKRKGAICIGIAACIGFSRLYLGVHFFSDVIAGMLLGWVIAEFVSWLYYKQEKSQKDSYGVIRK